jgi:hypothetical protein
MAFTAVQNGLYNALIEGLGLSRDSFQIIQPSPPLIPGNDRFLWNLLNNIPPASLTQNFILSGGSQLFSNYQALMDALDPLEPVNIKGDIGQDVFDAFIAYVKTLVPIPNPSSYPDLFFSWAFLNAPDVADIGASDYATILLDPVNAGKEALLPYLAVQGPHPTPALLPDWQLGYNDLVGELANAPAMQFAVSSDTMDTDVSQTWTGGDDSGFFGLWGGDDSSSSISSQFSDATFSLTASFGHVLNFQTNAGSWYMSSAIGQAFANHGSPPWRAGGAIQWEDVFGSPNGDLQRVMANLLVVDNMNIVVTASTAFSASDQTTIQNNSSGGFWPIYTSNSSSGSVSTATFDDSGAITIHISTAPNVPTVIGGNVLPIGRFVGASVSALHRRAERLNA